jgi:hypothetical protein
MSKLWELEMATPNLAKQSGCWNQIKSNQIQEAVSCAVWNIWTDMGKQSGRWNQIKPNQIQEAVSCTVCNIWTDMSKQSGRWNQIKSNQIQEAVSCTVCNIWTDMSRGERILQNDALVSCGLGYNTTGRQQKNRCWCCVLRVCHRFRKSVHPY